MCGIAGLIDKTGQLGRDGLHKLVERQLATLRHRGPDGHGVWHDRDIALGHRRLAIIDLSTAAQQPMATPDGRFTIAFNGEIYNYKSLRTDLAARGVAFRTESDTEVLLRLFEQKGVAAVSDLDGMFAFAVHDKMSGSTWLARDRFGEKPLYYADESNWFAFASELTALAMLPGFDLRIDATAISRYLTFQYIPAPESIYRGARKLPPGTWMHRDRHGALTVESFYRFKPGSAGAARPRSESRAELAAILDRSVRSRMVSDVPLGAFLSGGVDSALVAALAARSSPQPLKTFTVGFADHPASEHLEAAEMAALIGADHHEHVVAPDATRLCEDIAARLDEPNGDTSCLPTFILSEFARTKVTVALSGDGGDELFGGYGRYLATLEEMASGPTRTRGAAYWSSRLLVFSESDMLQFAGGVPAAVADQVAQLRDDMDSDPRSDIQVMRAADAAHYMPGAVLAKVDRMSMQVSLEVRAPLLSNEIAAFAETLSDDECISGSTTKTLLKDAAARVLPQSWLAKPKRGFGLPLGSWTTRTLQPAVLALLQHPDCRIAAWIDRGRMTKWAQNARPNDAYRLWSVMVLEHWLRTHAFEVGQTFAQTPHAVFARPPGEGRIARGMRLVRRVLRKGSPWLR